MKDDDASPAGWRALARPGSPRSLGLMAVGAVVGLAIAGFGLFTAKGASSRTLPPEDVALVNQRPILRSDFIAQTEALYSLPFEKTTPAQRRRVIADMLREELFVQRGLELDLAASDPDVRTALVTGVERQVEADVTAQQPSDAELRGWYAKRAGDYASEGVMTVHDLVSPRGAAGLDLAQAAAELRGGATLPQAVARHSLVDARAATGEEFWFAARLHLGETLFAAARGLKAGEAAGPVVVAGAPHLLVMQKNVPPVPLAFEAAREALAQDYLKAAQKRVEEADAAYLKGKADILVAPEYR